MDFILAKQLKDAGFPQKLEPWGNVVSDVAGGIHEKVYHPTLSELIEACGGQFNNLRHQDVGTWTASDKKGNMILACTTPEEAVAKLYIALHDDDVSSEE